jgi:hypothetical protein
MEFYISWVFYRQELARHNLQVDFTRGLNQYRKGRRMNRALGLAVIVAGTVLFGCDSPQQAKSSTEPVAQQSVVSEMGPKAEDAKAAVPAAETARAVSDNVQNKGEKPVTAPAPVAEKTLRTASSVVAEAIKASDDTTRQTNTAAALVHTPAATAETTRNAVSPQEILLKASNGNIAFSHGRHADAYACKTCHGDDTLAAFSISKDIAHKLCKGCHKTAGAGPTACNGCHKK